MTKLALVLVLSVLVGLSFNSVGAGQRSDASRRAFPRGTAGFAFGSSYDQAVAACAAGRGRLGDASSADGPAPAVQCYLPTAPSAVSPALAVAHFHRRRLLALSLTFVPSDGQTSQELASSLESPLSAAYGQPTGSRTHTFVLRGGEIRVGQPSLASSTNEIHVAYLTSEWLNRPAANSGPRFPAAIAGWHFGSTIQAATNACIEAHGAASDEGTDENGARIVACSRTPETYDLQTNASLGFCGNSLCWLLIEFTPAAQQSTRDAEAALRGRLTSSYGDGTVGAFTVFDDGSTSPTTVWWTNGGTISLTARDATNSVSVHYESSAINSWLESRAGHL